MEGDSERGSYFQHRLLGPRTHSMARKAVIRFAAAGSGENLKMRKYLLKSVSIISFVVAAAIFVPQRAAADQDDPPTRIARLSEANGSVSFNPAGTDDWVDAVVNRPMTTGDKLWADHDSRAELHLGSSSIRLGANTGFSFLNLDDNTTQLQLTEGTLRIRVQRVNRDEVFEVDTPNLAFSVFAPGIYRISVNEAGDTTVVSVRQGEGGVTGGGQSFSVHADEEGTFTGTDQLNADIEGAGDEDDLDRWSYERDRREDHSVSRRYVSDEAVGYEDLDEYGGWRDTPEYGTIWFPHTTVVGWAPYRYGHWVWISPWGYTWVEDEPWGFAPFHYGRWVVVGGAWGWVPCRPAAVGVAYVRPVYAPALVAWVGGPGFAVGVGGGAAVAWFPLGPREVYVPSYHVSRTYVNNVNITNTTVNTTVVNNYYTNVVVNKNVTNVRYVNQSASGAVTATNQQAFTSGQSVHNNMVRVDERQVASARVEYAAPASAPTKQAVLGAGRPANARPPAAVATRAVVAKTAPPPPPAKFERQQAAVQQNGGRPLAISQTRQIQQQEQPKAAVRMAPPAKPGTPTQNAGNRPGQQPNNNRPQDQNGNRAGQQPNNNRPQDQNNNRPAQQQGNQANQQPANQPPANAQPNNRPAEPPANAERPNAERPNNGQPANNNAPPPNSNRPNTQPPNAQRNDRPPAARTTPPPASGNPQLEQQHQQELQNMRKQQDQERQRLEQSQAQERQRADQQRADDQRKQQLQQQHQQQLQELEKKHDQQEQQVQQRQQQEHQQQRQQAPPPRQQQQERPKQQDKPKEKERDKPPKS